MIFFLFGLFLVLRLILIFHMPLFTDEAGYIRWGQLIMNIPSYRWISLSALGKQPLLLWLFGLAGLHVSPPDISPRIISLLFAVVAFLALYFWMKRYLGKTIALIGMYLFTVSPVFILFQSMALMESALLTATILSLWFLFLFRRYHSYKFVIFLGISLSLGFWIKTNFIIVVGIVFGILLYDRYKKSLLNLCFLYMLVFIFILTILPLIIHPDFPKLLTDVNHFAFTLPELLKFPVQIWYQNILQILLSLLLYLGPISLFALITEGIYHSASYRFLIIWFIPFILISLLLNKIISTRYYLLSFIPLVPITAGVIDKYLKKSQNLDHIFIIILLSITSFLGVFLVVNPLLYFNLFPQFNTIRNEREYVYTWTGGYATRNLIKYINNNQLSSIFPIILTVPDYEGNPTDYLMSNYYQSRRVGVTLVSTKKDLISLYKYFPKIPLYFITRESVPHQDILPFIKKVKDFPTPDHTDTVSIYRIIKLP